MIGVNPKAWKSGRTTCSSLCRRRTFWRSVIEIRPSRLSTLRGRRRDSMSADVLQWSLARPGALLPDPVAANSSAQSLVTVDASASATGPRVATASRRKVVGVDCVERFILFRGSPACQGAGRVRSPGAAEPHPSRRNRCFGQQRAAADCVGGGRDQADEDDGRLALAAAPGSSCVTSWNECTPRGRRIPKARDSLRQDLRQETHCYEGCSHENRRRQDCHH